MRVPHTHTLKTHIHTHRRMCTHTYILAYTRTYLRTHTNTQTHSRVRAQTFIGVTHNGRLYSWKSTLTEQPDDGLGSKSEGFYGRGIKPSRKLETSPLTERKEVISIVSTNTMKALIVSDDLDK